MKRVKISFFDRFLQNYGLLGGWIGSGRFGVPGKNTELKLVDGEVGVCGAKGLEHSKGDEVLGKVSKGRFRS